MSGYVGERARRRKFRLYSYGFLLLTVLLLFYFFYYDTSFDQQKVEKEELNNSDDSQITIQNNFNIEEYEIKIFQKDQKINSLNKTIKSQINEIKNLIAEKNLLIENNQNYIAEIQSINSQNEEKYTNIDKLTTSIKNIENEKQTILREYKEVANENLKYKLLVESLDEKISELNNLIHDQQKTISKQENIIKELEDISHHN